MRAIDGDAVLDRYYAEFEKQDICDGSQDKDWLMRCIKEAPTLTPPNEPLTLEQLREMKDKPAYLKVFDPLLKSGWHIIKAVTEDKIIFRGWQTVYVPIDGMGIDYNLYRRPPKGSEDVAENATPEFSECEYCCGEPMRPLDWQYGLDHVFPDYKYCPMCGRKVRE